MKSQIISLRTANTGNIYKWMRMASNKQAYRAREEFMAWADEGHEVTSYEKWLISHLLGMFNRYL